MAEQKFLGEAGLNVLVDKIKANTTITSQLRHRIDYPFQSWYKQVLTYLPYAFEGLGSDSNQMLNYQKGIAYAQEMYLLGENLFKYMSGLTIPFPSDLNADNYESELEKFFSQDIENNITLFDYMDTLPAATFYHALVTNSDEITADEVRGKFNA